MTDAPSIVSRQREEDEAVRWFSDQMLTKLRENRGKGGWRHETDFSLLGSIANELHELVDALHAGDPKEIARECADVANFAMFIADNHRKDR